MNILQLWEILVPTTSHSGLKYSSSVHQHWDKQVSKITGGLTVQRVVKGTSNCTTGVISEDMIPVRIAVNGFGEILEIVKITKDYYNQESVFVYKISDSAHIL